jgi:hydrogenase maturation factor
MLGEVAKDRLVQSSNLTPGDCILLTKGLGIEATSILAREKADELAAANIPSKTITRAANYLIDPGISVLKEARIACDTAKIHAMHDPTEGGVATALREMALVANVGLSINEEALFTTTETQQLCQTFNLDSLGIISSGALLIGVSESDANTVCAAIQNADIRCDIIGRAEDPSFGLKLNNTNLPHFDRDEIGKVFE